MAGVPSKWLIRGAVLIAVLAALWFYGHSRYQAGVDATDAKWVKAGEVLKAKAAKSQAKADVVSAWRVGAEVERVRKEKERLDEAEANGSSPLDVLFGAGN